MRSLSFLFALLVLLLAGCSSNNMFTKDDDFISNELCGEALYGSNPCAYVKEIDVYLNGNLVGSDSFKVYSQYLSNKVVDMNEKFSDLNVKGKLKPFYKRIWFQQPKEDSSNIEVTFLLTETPDKKFIIITFYTFSKGAFQIGSYQCPESESNCVVESMQKIIDEKIVKPITANGK